MKEDTRCVRGDKSSNVHEHGGRFKSLPAHVLRSLKIKLSRQPVKSETKSKLVPSSLYFLIQALRVRYVLSAAETPHGCVVFQSIPQNGGFPFVGFPIRYKTTNSGVLARSDTLNKGNAWLPGIPNSHFFAPAPPRTAMSWPGRKERLMPQQQADSPLQWWKLIIVRGANQNKKINNVLMRHC